MQLMREQLQDIADVATLPPTEPDNGTTLASAGQIVSVFEAASQETVAAAIEPKPQK